MSIKTPTQRDPASDPVVLIIDGHDDTRELYVEGLSVMGFRPITAGDGLNGYQCARESHPDVIVTELTMPSLGGWDFLERMKRDPRTRDIPVVVLTGYANPALMARAEQEGCAEVLFKPCLPEELATQLRHVLDQKSAERLA